MLNSFAIPLNAVTLPQCEGRQFYMHAFDLANPVMPEGFADYLKPVVDLCRAAGAMVGTAYMTVDEKFLRAGETQRKPKPHVDGCFKPASVKGWSHGGWNHSCNIVPFKRMPVIVASSVSACKVWEGQFDAQPKEDGDLSHVELGDGAMVPANVGYLLSPDCIHESLPMTHDTARTFLRIALPVEFVAQKAA